MKQELIVAGLLVIALIAAFAVDGLGLQPVICDESGNELASLFVGAAADSGAVDAILGDGALARGSPTPCQNESAVIRHFLSWISPPPVSASGCGAGCTGHYQRSEYRQCPTGCNSNDGHRFFYSDPQRAPWYRGRQEAGDLACGNCGPCHEQDCVNYD